MCTIRIPLPTLCGLVLLAASLPAVAAGPVSPFVQKSISPGLTREGFIARSVAVFDRLDDDADGYVDAADALSYARGQAAIARAANVGRLLAFDLDGDARVDLRELASGLRRGLPLPDGLAAAPGDASASASAALVSLDANADGRISVTEMLAIPVAEASINPVSAFLSAFPTATGRLSREAFVQGMLEQAFDRVDRDGDGVLSRDEVETAGARPAR